SGALTAMRLAELQGLASSMGIDGTAKMRKGDLVAAIKARQNGDNVAVGEDRRDSAPRVRADGERNGRPQPDHDTHAAGGERHPSVQREDRPTREDRRGEEPADAARRDQQGRPDRPGQRGQQDRQQDQAVQSDEPGQRGQQDRQQDQHDRQGQRDRQPEQQHDRAGQRDDEEGRGGRRRRNRGRNRDKRRGQGAPGGEQADPAEPQIREDDVLVPVAGILDILDNYAFVRTTGYLPGSSDVYVPLQMVKRYGLRKGDAVTGSIKAPREGEEPQQQTVGSRNNRQKYTPLARLDTVNAMTPDDARRRPEFGKLTPLYPQDRLRLETEQSVITTRIIDLVAPIGKGQRGLINAPAKAGKTMVMQALANAITTNNPEVHLMVVLVDERPEEVTDMQRAVKGEVISSTFDRPADDHTTVAELAIERAKRLVEMGHDVVVLLDSITKLGRAYNLAAPASGRILSGGVDSAALYPPKKFFGAA
ncbi:MAG: transcription termination factor Rho, partial [Phycicoccus sp.]